MGIPPGGEVTLATFTSWPGGSAGFNLTSFQDGLIYGPCLRESDDPVNIWSLGPVSASLFDLDATFSEAMELNPRALAHSGRTSLTFVSNFGKRF